MQRTITALAACSAMGASATSLLSQPQQSILTPIDQGYADRTANSASARLPEADLRLPVGFERAYRVRGSAPWRQGSTPTSGVYARVSGGLVAVFPQSQYTKVGRYTRADVPPGTVYVFNDGHHPATTPARAGNDANLMRRINPFDVISPTLPEPQSTTPRIAQPVAPASDLSVWTDEEYRQRRVGQLIDAAFTIASANASESTKPESTK
jgi:hypothetical protein